MLTGILKILAIVILLMAIALVGDHFQREYAARQSLEQLFKNIFPLEDSL